MPLTPSKARHIMARLDHLYLGRTQAVTLTLKNPDGSLTSRTLNAIFRLVQDGDPTLSAGVSDALALVRASDITLAQLRSCVYVTPPAGSVAAQLSPRYLITSVTPKGMLPDPDRWIITLDRQL